jgi:hypothetical protein
VHYNSSVELNAPARHLLHHAKTIAVRRFFLARRKSRSTWALRMDRSNRFPTDILGSWRPSPAGGVGPGARAVGGVAAGCVPPAGRTRAREAPRAT